MNKKVTITLSETVYDKCLSLVHVLNYLNQKNESDEEKVEDLIEGAVINYIERFYDSLINEHKNSHLISLGNSKYPLRFNLEPYIEEKEMPLTHIAKQLDISLGSLRGIINNRHMPSVDIFIRLWVLIGCPPLHEILYREKGNEHHD
jgi:hypothetical protein